MDSLLEDCYSYRLILLDSKNQECPVTLCQIEKNQKYCICQTCNYNFSLESLEIIKNASLCLKCPLCQCGWNPEDTKIYINV